MKLKNFIAVVIVMSMTPINLMQAFATGNNTNTPPSAPTGLMIEHSNVPLGIEDSNPAMSWVVNDADNNEIQTAYRVLYASTLEKLEDDDGDIWDSGKVISSESSNAEYNGDGLPANTRIYWKVKTWDKDGAESPWSEPQLFSTAVKDEWQADAIWADYDTAEGEKGNAVFLRKEFNVSKPVERAIASSIGKDPNAVKSYTYKLYLNGEYAGAGPTRGIKDGQRTEVYDTFDVTDKIKQGANCVSSINYCNGEDKRFQMQIKIFYQDGETEIIKTDDTWKGMDGTYAYGDDKGLDLGGHKVMAEYIDNRIFPLGFDDVGFDDSQWKSAVKKDTIKSDDLYASPLEPMNEVEMPVEKIVKKSDGNYFIQLEREIIGGLKLTLPSGVAGNEMTILYGEETESENTVKWQTRAGNNYKEVWTMRDGAQEFQTFGVKNFRYIEIQNCPVELTADMIKGIGIQQAFDWNDSYFISSDDVLNEVWELCKYTIKASNQNMYVDSLTRERMPYEGDNYINQLTSFTVSRNYNLPRYSNMYVLYNPTWPAEYRMLAIQSTYNDYLYTGETSVIEEYYEKLKENLLLSSDESEIDEETGLLRVTTAGDLRPIIDYPAANRDGYDVDNTPYNTVVNSYLYYSLNLMAKMADIIGKTSDANEYREQAESVRTAMFDNLLDMSDGFFIEGLNSKREKVTGKAFATSIYPLLHNVVTDEIQQKNLSDFIAKDLMNGDRGNVYTAQFLLQAYYKMGKAQAGMDILSGTGSKSWYNMIHKLNATMTTEKFDFDGLTFTFSHPWSSSAANVMVRDMMGVQPLEAAFDKIQIKPQTADLESAEVKTPTIKGAVIVKTEKNTENAAYELTTTTPANTTAKIYVPADIVSHNKVIVDGVAQDATREGNFFVFDNVGSGTHTFVVPYGPALNLTTEGILRAGITTPLKIDITDGVSLSDAEISCSSSREDVLTAVPSESGCLFTLNKAGRSTVTVNIKVPEVNIGGIKYIDHTLTQTIDIIVEDADSLNSALKKYATFELSNYTAASVESAQTVVDEMTALNTSGQYVDEDLPAMLNRLNSAYASLMPAYQIETDGKATFSALPSAEGGEAAWDGNVQTTYQYGRADGGYTGIDLGEGTDEKVAVIRFYSAGETEKMIGGRFEGSNDKWTWDCLCEIEDAPVEGWNQLPAYPSNTYRYIRYTASNNCSIAEIELYSGSDKQARAAAKVVIGGVEKLDLTNYSDATKNEFASALEELKAVAETGSDNEIYEKIDALKKAERNLAPEGVEYCYLTLNVIDGIGTEKISVNGAAPVFAGETVRVVKGSEVSLLPVIDNDVDYKVSGWYDKNNTKLTEDEEYKFTVLQNTTAGVMIEKVEYENLALGKNVNSSGVTENSEGWSKAALTDGTLDSVLGNLGFSSQASETNYLSNQTEIDLGESKEFNRIQLYPRTDALAENGRTPGFPEDFKIQISDDGQNYTTIREFTGFAAPDKKPAVIQFSKRQKARFIRIETSCIGDRVGNGDFYLQLCEMGVYNVPDGVDAPMVEKIKHKWSASENITRSDELMPGLYPCDDLTYSKDPVVIDGKSFTGRVSSTDTPKGNPINQGAALKYTAPANGEITVYCKNLGKGKVLQIDRRINGRNEVIAQYTNSADSGQNVALSATIEEGVEYYLYVPGSKGQFAGVEALLEADAELIPDPDATPAPTPTVDPNKVVYEAVDAVDFYASDGGSKPKLAGAEVGYLYNRENVKVGYAVENFDFDNLESAVLNMPAVRKDNTYLSITLDAPDGKEIANQKIETGENVLNFVDLEGVTGKHKIYLLYYRDPYAPDDKYLANAGDITARYIGEDSPSEGVEIGDVNISGDNLTFDVSNNTDGSVAIFAYVVQYNADGAVVSVSIEQNYIIDGWTGDTIAVSYIKDDSAESVKLFIWNENMEPYCEAISII